MTFILALYVSMGMFFAHPIVTVLARGGKWKHTLRAIVGFTLFWPLITPFLWKTRVFCVNTLDGKLEEEAR